LLETTERVQLKLSLAEPGLDPQHLIEEFMLLVWHRYFNWLIGARMTLLETAFSFARPGHAAEHAFMFPGLVHYAAGVSCIRFPPHFMDQPVVRKRSELRGYLQRLPDDWFIKQVFTQNLVDRIYQQLMEAGEQAFPDMRSLAAHWNTTTRTLHRHLLKENSSFRQIRDQVRRDKAIGWLLDDNCQVGEVARRLGMTEPAFSRAFKSWTGLTPLVYRRSRSGDQLAV
jgi:AraC-like DNA-binding protein